MRQSLRHQARALRFALSTTLCIGFVIAQLQHSSSLFHDKTDIYHLHYSHLLSQNHHQATAICSGLYKMPGINDLPNELMVEAFSYLDFKDLTRCMRVNKSFQTLTEHSSFDKIFFRTKPIKPGDPMNLDKLQINPAFDHLTYTSRSKIKDAEFLICYKNDEGKDDVRGLPLIDSSAAKQNATEPAVTRIYLRPYGRNGVMVESNEGLTVQDVMEGLCNYYKKGRSYDRCHYFFEGFYKSNQSNASMLVLEAHWGS